MLDTVISFRHLPRDLRLFIWSWGLIGFGYFGVFGVLFNLYLLRLGYGPGTIGLLVGAGQLAWGIAAIPAGIVGSRYGNRTAMLWGVTSLTATYSLLLIGEVLPIGIQTGWIATWWIASWVAGAFWIVNNVPYVMEVSAPEDRRNIFTLQQAMLGICGFAGSLAAGILPNVLVSVFSLGKETTTPYWYALWLAPLSYLTAMLLLARTQPQPQVIRETRHASNSKMPHLLILFVGVMVFLQTSGEGVVRTFFNVYLDATLEAPLARIGIVMGLAQFLPILSSLTAPTLVGRWGTPRTIIAAGVISGLFMLVMALFANWIAASIGYIGILLTIAIAAIARTLFSQEIVAPQWRTAMSSVFTVGLALGWASAAGLGGYLIASFGYQTLFLLSALTALGSGVLLWGYIRIDARSETERASPNSSR